LFVGCGVIKAEGNDNPLGKSIAFEDIVRLARTKVGDKTYFENYGFRANGYIDEAILRELGKLQGCALCVRFPNGPDAVRLLSTLIASAEVVIAA
jgi:hypothetical protein